MATPTTPDYGLIYNDNPTGQVNTMGIGLLGAPTTNLLRQFRFLFGITFCNGQKVDPNFVKTAGRPDITVDDTELNFLNETIWIPGKAKWETITVTYYDVATDQKTKLLSWLATVYDFTSDTRKMASRVSDYAGTGHLVMLDGCGAPIEKWTLNNMFPTSIKFGELDYSQSEIASIELVLRYSAVTYKSLCPIGQPKPCPCTPCGK